MPQVEQLNAPKPIEKYLVVQKLGTDVKLLVETSNFNSAASYHLKHATPSSGIYILKNIDYSFTAKETGR